MKMLRTGIILGILCMLLQANYCMEQLPDDAAIKSSGTDISGSDTKGSDTAATGGEGADEGADGADGKGDDIGDEAPAEEGTDAEAEAAAAAELAKQAAFINLMGSHLLMP